MRIGSLFSGAGGLDMAVEHVFGGETVWHCEIDRAASKVLAHRWPGVPNLHDITAVDWSTVEPVDIMCGGWPCQPFSLAGRRKGAEDERALWPYVAGAVRMVRPRIVVLENVSAVLGPEFQRVANDLAALGYDIAWTCLRAAAVGAPHRRERLFILAADTDCGRREVGAELDSYTAQAATDGNPPWRHASGHDYQTAANSTGDGRDERWPESAGLIGGSDAAVSGAGPIDLLPTPTARDWKGGQSNQFDANDALRLLPTPRSSDCFGAGLHGDGGMDLRTTVSLLQTPSTADGDGGHLNRSGSRKGEPLLPGQAREMATSWGKYEPAIRRWETLTRPAPAPTEPNTKGNPRLSSAFSEWMLGWPTGWVTAVPGISRNDALRIIGNGVVPQQATAALQWLLSVCEVAA